MSMEHVPYDLRGVTEITSPFGSMFEQPTVSDVWAQFGVFRGTSARIMYRQLPESGELHLFDSFEGLPETWVRGGPLLPLEKGRFDMGGKPPDLGFDPRAVYHVGWVEHTLKDWADDRPLGIIDLDMDLYSSTITALRALDHRIVPGTIIRFDELVGYENYEEHEWRAYQEWGREIEWRERGRYWMWGIVQA